jgi:hypothetical protein
MYQSGKTIGISEACTPAQPRPCRGFKKKNQHASEALMKTADFIALHPRCCFCSGVTDCETIDHQPAKIIFPDKWRPQGLEFPACLRCNQLTSIDECLLAFVARMTGSLRRPIEPDTGYFRALTTLSAAKPDLMRSMKAETPDGLGALNVNHPEISESFGRIAAKLAMGIYYLKRRKIAATNTLINTFWTHNQREQTKYLVPHILSKFPQSQHLRQGRKHTDETFFIHYVIDDTIVQVAAVFYESVALMAHFDDLADYCEGHDWQITFTPHAKHGLMKVSWDGDGGRRWRHSVIN